MREKSHSVTAPFFIFRKTLRTGLEFIRRLDARVVAELEVLRSVQGIPLADPPGPEGVESLQEEVLRRDVARTDGEAPDPVQVTVRQGFRAVTAEEGNLIQTSDNEKTTDEEQKAHSITAIWNYEKQNYFLKNL